MDSVHYPDGYHQCFQWEYNRRCEMLVPHSTNYCNRHRPVGEHRLPIVVATTDHLDHTYTTPLRDSLLFDGPSELTWYEWTNSGDDEQIDSWYANSLSHIKNYRGKHMLNDVHFRIQVHGARNDIDLFYAILHEVDDDFPLDPFRNRNAKIKQCSSCKGYVWARSVVTPEKIKKAAKQAGVKARIKLWIEGHKCKGQVVDTTVA